MPSVAGLSAFFEIDRTSRHPTAAADGNRWNHVARPSGCAGSLSNLCMSGIGARVRNSDRPKNSCVQAENRPGKTARGNMRKVELRRRVTMTAPFGVERGPLRVMAGADPPSTTCSADLRKIVDDLPAQAMTVWVGHSQNGAAIVMHRLSVGCACSVGIVVCPAVTPLTTTES
jgi:hypothetical protein